MMGARGWGPAAGLALACALTGCSLAPPHVRPALPVPAGWPAGDAYLVQGEATLPSLTYVQVFRDPRLRTLIEQALANNRDLRIAAANIEAARARYRIQRAERLPVVAAGAGARIGESGGTGTVTGGAGTGSVPGTGVARGGGGGVNESYSVDLGVTAFEIDLFGRVRSLSDAALARYFATEAAARSTRLALVGDIAIAWLDHAADASLLRIAQQTAQSARNSVRLTRARLEGGIAPRTDLRQAELVLAQAEADVAQQRTLLAQDANALALLVGAPVDPALLPGAIEEAGDTVAEVPAGLESGILLRRPDIVAAEYDLVAANADIGAARAALFPRISLTAVAGLASAALDSLFGGDAFSWSVAPGIDYPVFAGGALRAGVRLSEADRVALVAAYERAIQSAFREVADALARRGTIDEQERATRALVEAAQDNARLSEARYRGGIESFLQSLDAQRAQYQAERTLVQVQRVRAANRVTLYRALGGDDTIANAPVAGAQAPPRSAGAGP